MTLDALIDAIERENQAFSGTLGVHARRLDDGLEVAFNATESFPAASVIKLPMLILALERVQQGQLRLEARQTMRAEDRAGGSGVLGELDAGLEPSVLDLLKLMMVVSDNTATNMVLDLLGGVESTNAGLKALKLEVARVVGKLQVPWEHKTPAQRAGQLAMFSPKETTGLLERLERGQLLDEVHTKLARQILKAQQYTEILARYLPQTITGSKSGSIEGVRNDVGLVWGSRPYAISLASHHGHDLREHIDNEAVLALARVSKLIFDFFEG